MIGVADGAAVLERAFAAGLKPESRLSVVEWSDKYRYLSAVEAAEPGLYRSSRTPFWREPMEGLTPGSGIKRTVICKAAQIGATVLGLNWIGYSVDESPCPMMLVLPDLGLAKRYSSQRLDPMFEDSPRLAGKLLAARGRESQSSALWKRFAGGVLAIVGANSPSGFRSTPARRLMLDEIDAFPPSVGEEGDPVKLARRALTNFEHDGQELAISTPTFEGRSRITELFEDTDKRYYFVPCPHCGHFQTLEWSGIKWDEGDPSSARYQCQDCERPIDEHHKTAMLEAGEWRATNFDPDLDPSVRGYHLNSLYSPLGWLSWAKVVQEFLEAQGKPQQLRVWVNHRLGQTWRESGEAPPWELLYRRRETYPIGTVPEGVAILTCGVDVQGDRLELEVVGWGPGLESWSVAYMVIPWGPNDPRSWQDLDGIIDADWPCEAGGSVRIRMIAIDAGYATMDVRTFVRKRGEPGRTIAVRGTDSAAVLLSQPRTVDITRGGKKIKRGVKEWSVGGPVAKVELYGWLRLEEPLEDDDPYPPGWCHFPEWDQEYFRQLTAEEVVLRYVRGYPKHVWEKRRDRNEALDCRVYARAAAHALGVDRWKPERWKIEAAKLGASRGAVPSVSSPKKKARRRQRRRDGGGWMERFR